MFDYARKTDVDSLVAQAKTILDRFVGERFAKSRAVHKTIWGSPAGKKRLAERLAAMLPAHKTYVEPFAGSGAVLFAKEPVEVEVLNDADPEIARAFRCIKRLTSSQIDKLRSMPWTGDEALFKQLIDKKPQNDVDALHRFLYLSHFSYGKLRGKSFSPSSKGVEARTVERIETFAPRLKNVRIFDGDYLTVVKKYDGPNTVFFFDPPYVGHNVNVGESTFDEERFFDVLKSLKGKFLLTYGIRGKLPELLKNSDFNVARIRTRRSIRSMRGVGGPSMLTQLVVTNYKPVEKAMVSDDDWLVEDIEKTQPFGTFGGSHHYAKRLLPLIPQHKTYVEPFAGAAALLHAKEPSDKEVIADLDDDVVFMHRFVKGMNERALDGLKRFNWTCTDASWKRVRNLAPKNDLERFYKLAFIRGKGRDARPDATHPAGSAMGQATNPEKYLKAAARLKNVSILKQDYRKTIEQQDGPETFFFIDPPYPDEWFDKKAVIDLDEFVETLKAIKGKYIAVLNDSPENVAVFKKLGRVFRLKVNEASGTGGAKKAARLFCANYKVQKTSLPASLLRGERSETVEEVEQWGEVPLPDAFNKSVPLIKDVDPQDERFVLGIVLEPDVVDAQEDIYSADEIRQAAHRFMEEFGGLGLMHRFRVNDQVKVLESYLAPGDFQIKDKLVTKGTWLLAVRIISDELWDQVKNGQLTGFSIGGSARRVLSPESSVEGEAEKQELTKAVSPAQDSKPKTQDSVYRLVDMVVEEVSLVDRAANKQRFLIVKRSEEMSDINTLSTDTDESVNASGEEADDQEDQLDADEETEPRLEANPTLEAAVAALQSLTEAVELLANAGDDGVQDRVRQLADDLHAIAERLTTDNGTEEPLAPTNAKPPQAKPDLETVIGSVKEALGRMNALAAANSKSKPSSDPGDGLAPLVEELRTLTSTVRQQQQRLSKLEKRFGLPSSVPAGESPRRSDVEEVGWPLDMNRACDRESVDKSVSFHDV